MSHKFVASRIASKNQYHDDGDHEKEMLLHFDGCEPMLSRGIVQYFENQQGKRIDTLPNTSAFLGTPPEEYGMPYVYIVWVYHDKLGGGIYLDPTSKSGNPVWKIGTK